MIKEDIRILIKKELMKNPEASSIEIAKKCKIPVELVELFIIKTRQ